MTRGEHMLDKKGFSTVERGLDFLGVGVFLCLEGLRAALERTAWLLVFETVI